MDYDNYINGLNDIISRHGFKLSVTRNDFRFLDEVVIADAFNEERPFSVMLTRQISPPIHSGEFFHYTRAVDEILNSQTLRLTSVQKRVGEDELRDFLQEFGFEYPLEIDPETNEPRFLKTVAAELFYTSFTDASLSGPDEDYFWETFAGKDGARLKFKIELGSGCLRKMVYGDAIKNSATFFREISEFTRKTLGKIFFWEDSATVCALHLPSCYKIECETRLITRRSSGFRLGKQGGYEYQEVPFEGENLMKIKLQLMEIQTDRPVTNPYGAAVIPRSPSP